MNYIGILIILLIVLEVRFKPRLSLIKEHNFYKLILWYSIKSKYNNVIIRDYISLVKF